MQTQAHTQRSNVRQRLRTGFSAMASVAKRLAVTRGIDAWVQEVSPTFSLSTLRARVVDIVVETHDTKTFVLEPNRHWPGHVAGQFVPVEVEVDGVTMVRCYSVSSAPHQKHLALTVKRVPGGRVSGALHDRLRVGDVLRLGAPTGDFVLPAQPPEKLLLLSGGSGVTPVMAILRSLANANAMPDIVFLHAARSAKDVVFHAELRRLAALHSGLRLEIVLDDAPDGRLDPSKLRSLVPDLAERVTMMCGPSGMMDALTPVFSDAGIAHRLRTERFALETRPVRATGPSPKVKLTLLRSKKTAATECSGTLLEALERSGETPAHGCRMGICNTCLCRKKSGIVEDTVTGAVSAEPDADIRLCTSRALSDLELVF